LPLRIPEIRLGPLTLLPALVVGIVMFAGRIVDSLADPLIGQWSDKTKTRLGRRIPFVLYCTVPLALSFVLVWFPPVAGQSLWNVAHLTLALGAFWFFFTAVVAPYLSLLPEIVTSIRSRINVSSWQGVFEIAAGITTPLAAGVLIARYAPENGGANLGLVHLPDGFKLMSLLLGAIICVSLLLSITLVREKPMSESKAVSFRFIEACRLCFKNPSFPPYVIGWSFYRTGINLLMVATPFLFKSVVGVGEGETGAGQALIALVAVSLFWLNARLARGFGKRNMLMAGGIALGALMVLMALSPVLPMSGFTIGEYFVSWRLFGVLVLFFLFGCAAPPIYVMPRAMIADVMDYDERLTGFRRECMYNGMEGLITKLAVGLAPIIFGLLGYFGNTAEKPLGILLAGPVAGALLIIGALIFSRYPIKE